MFDIKIRNFIDASDLAAFVEFEWGIPQKDAYQTLSDNDYIEGNMGSLHVKGEKITDDVSKWVQEFLIRWDLQHVYLRYGG
jgi:hypothetical protein